MNPQSTTRRYTMAILAMLLLAPLASDCFGQAPQNQPPKPPVGLAWVVQPNGPQMEAEFTNNTERELAIQLGKEKCRLKPGKSQKLLFQNQQSLKVAEIVPELPPAKSQVKMRYSGVIPPQANQGNLKILEG